MTWNTAGNKKDILLVSGWKAFQKASNSDLNPPKYGSLKLKLKKGQRTVSESLNNSCQHRLFSGTSADVTVWAKAGSEIIINTTENTPTTQSQTFFCRDKQSLDAGAATYLRTHRQGQAPLGPVTRPNPGVHVHHVSVALLKRSHSSKMCKTRNSSRPRACDHVPPACDGRARHTLKHTSSPGAAVTVAVQTEKKRTALQ